MRVLDLCSGLGGLSAAFVERGHEVVTVDIEPRFNPTICKDILQMCERCVPGPWDVILAGVPCEAFSVASIGHHWGGGWRVYTPRTEHAKLSKRIVERTLWLIERLEPRYWVMENPRGVLRKMPFMQAYERRTVTYCQYGETRMKPTDLWGRFPDKLALHPMCKNGDPCHVRAPRGARTGTQGIKGSAERALVPYRLSEQLCIAME